MKNKNKLLKTACDKLLKPGYILYAAYGGVAEDDAFFWTYEQHGENKFIGLRALMWMQGHWIEKSYSETEGLFALNCPLEFFDFEVNKDTIIPSWRRDVRRFHENQAK